LHGLPEAEARDGMGCVAVMPDTGTNGDLLGNTADAPDVLA
jgi:hypothetical protein